jgi:hypothetical protein
MNSFAADISKVEITEAIDRATLANKLLAPYVRTYIIENYETALLFVDGKYVKTLAGRSVLLVEKRDPCNNWESRYTSVAT